MEARNQRESGGKSHPYATFSKGQMQMLVLRHFDSGFTAKQCFEQLTNVSVTYPRPFKIC